MAMVIKKDEDFESLIRQYADQAESARQLAHADIAAGQLRFIYNDAVYYDLAEWTPEYNRLVQERLGGTPWVMYKIDAPNFDAQLVFQAVHYRCMVAEIEARFGAGIVDRLRAEAKAIYSRRGTI